MASRKGLNSPCRCGSGKKTKNCCGVKSAPVYWTKLNKILLAILIIAGGGAAITVLMSEDSPSTSANLTPTAGNTSQAQPIRLDLSQPSGSKQLKPRPPGEAPAGKVWNAEHGHWHDDDQTLKNSPGYNAATPSGELRQIEGPDDTYIARPQPAGEVPEGKYWSSEHGHWHNIGDTSAHVTSTPAPKPPGPPPEPGQFWSAEHGHWHSLPNTEEMEAQKEIIQQQVLEENKNNPDKANEARFIPAVKDPE